MTNTVSRILSDDTLNRIIQIESAGNPNARAPTSSAGGLGQFLNGTWLNVVGKHKPQLLKGRSQAAVTAMRVGTDTAALQVEMLARFTEDNAALLGKGFTDGDLYLAHFLGIGDARKLFRAPPSDLASNHVTAAAVAANRSILSGKTCQQVRTWAQVSMEGRWHKAGEIDWVKKWCGVQPVAPPDVPPVNVPAPAPKPPLTKKQTGIMALLAAAAASVLAWAEANPVVIVCVLVIAVAAFFIIRHWRRS